MRPGGEVTCLASDRRTSVQWTLSPGYRGRSMWVSLVAFGWGILRGSWRLSVNSDSLLTNTDWTSVTKVTQPFWIPQKKLKSDTYSITGCMLHVPIRLQQAVTVVICCYLNWCSSGLYCLPTSDFTYSSDSPVGYEFCAIGVKPVPGFAKTL